MKFGLPFDKKSVLTFIFLAAVVAAIFGLNLLLHTNQAMYPEVDELDKSGLVSFSDAAEYFRTLAETKGAEYAFSVLLRAKLAPEIDVHLLGHVVGNVLYKQEGIGGISTCTQDFRNACSHSVVIGILNDYGEGALDQIAETCKKAPGGRGAYTMCFHGLGHGVLAYTGYDLEKAIAMCKRTGTKEYNDREYVECVGGTIMEIIEGVHDVEKREAQAKKYLFASDPLSPCDLSFMPREVQPICLTYLTPHMFLTAGMDLGNINPSLYGKAFAYCAALPEDDAELRDACYGGFGKEFIGIAHARDIRDVGSMQEPALKKIREWCNDAGNTAGIASCNAAVLGSLFWGGENNPDASFTFCQIAPTDSERHVCYAQLAGVISFYYANDSRGQEVCKRIPDTERSICQDRKN